MPRAPRPRTHVRDAEPPELAWPERPERHPPPHAGTAGTTRREGHRYGTRGKPQPSHAGVAPLLPCGPRDHDVSGPGPRWAATGGTVGTGTPAASGNRRTTPGAAPPQWTRILLSARQRRHASLHASGRRWSDSRRRENRPDGLSGRGLEPGPWWHGEPTPPSQEWGWKPSTYSRRARPRPYQVRSVSLKLPSHDSRG